MANFRTHITTSTICGLAYGAYGYAVANMSLSSCIVASGLGSLSGMLPDLDSDNGIPVRETFCFASAVIPVLMIDRFETMGMTHEEMVIAAAGIYFFVRFGISRIFKKYTVHRGMWHSIPACAICGILAYIICSCEHQVRMFKSMAVVIGFMSHLILDEIYSVDLRGRRLKKSFGTAVKLFGKKWWPNVSTYGKLALLVVAVTVGERKFIEYFREPANRFHYRATQVVDKAGRVVDQATDALDHALGRNGEAGHSHSLGSHFGASASNASFGGDIAPIQPHQLQAPVGADGAPTLQDRSAPLPYGTPAPSRAPNSRAPNSRAPNSRAPNSRAPNSRAPNSRAPNSRAPNSNGNHAQRSPQPVRSHSIAVLVDAACIAHRWQCERPYPAARRWPPAPRSPFCDANRATPIGRRQ